MVYSVSNVAVTISKVRCYKKCKVQEGRAPRRPVFMSHVKPITVAVVIAIAVVLCFLMLITCCHSFIYASDQLFREL